MEKIKEIPGGGGSNTKPSGTENPVGWGVKLEKTLRGGSMDIFWNHTLSHDSSLFLAIHSLFIGYSTSSLATIMARNNSFTRAKQCKANLSYM